MLALHVQHARFVRDCGGLYLQVIDERPKGRAVVADDYRRLGRLMTELGKRTADVGVPLVYHHHMNSIGEKPQEVAAVLDAADPRARAAAVRRRPLPAGRRRSGRRDSPVPRLDRGRAPERREGRWGLAGGPGLRYQFVELGRGRVDLPGVFAALREIAFDKWAIVELDRVPDPGRTPKESAEMNKRYLVERAHQTILDSRQSRQSSCRQSIESGSQSMRAGSSFGVRICTTASATRYAPPAIISTVV